jgi:hypothetical protein
VKGEAVVILRWDVFGIGMLEASLGAASGVVMPAMQAGSGSQADCFSPFTLHALKKWQT